MRVYYGKYKIFYQWNRRKLFSNEYSQYKLRDFKQIELSCNNCRQNLNALTSKNIQTIKCFEIINNEHTLYRSNRPQGIGYVGILEKCGVCDKETLFNLAKK